MAGVLIDTNVIIGIIDRRDRRVLSNAAVFKRGGRKFTLCPIVYFEYRRGCLNRGVDTTGRAKGFDRFVVAECEWAHLDQAVLQKAAWLWSRHRGERVGDADLLMAATALVSHLPVATRNTRHLSRFGVEVWNWYE